MRDVHRAGHTEENNVNMAGVNFQSESFVTYFKQITFAMTTSFSQKKQDLAGCADCLHKSI